MTIGACLVTSLGLSVLVNPNWDLITRFALPTGIIVGLITAGLHLFLLQKLKPQILVFIPQSCVVAILIGVIGFVLGRMLGTSELWSLALISYPVMAISLGGSCGCWVILILTNTKDPHVQ
jgi:hypothetical protein